MRNGLIYTFLNMTAWHMDPPAVFGRIHIIAALITAMLAFVMSLVTVRKYIAPCRPHTLHPGSTQSTRSAYDIRIRLYRVLFIAGCIMALFEIYKQLFLYYIVNDRVYDWWYFPFQLCSVPMYLCILIPLQPRGKLQRTRLNSIFLTFMSSYTFLSAAAALIFPEDFLRPYLTLTLHGFVWHGMLLFISLVILLSGAAVSSTRTNRHPTRVLDTAAMFALLCIAAVLINIAAEPAMQTAFAEHKITHSYAAMFYLNPFHISPQPVVSNVQAATGIQGGLILYVLSIAAASSLMIVFNGKYLTDLICESDLF